MTDVKLDEILKAIQESNKTLTEIKENLEESAEVWTKYGVLISALGIMLFALGVKKVISILMVFLGFCLLFVYMDFEAIRKKLKNKDWKTLIIFIFIGGLIIGGIILFFSGYLTLP